jgi:glycogen debranching enzyme
VRRRSAPTLYPVACAPQAWASAAVFGLLQASVGVSFDPTAAQIRFDRPRLPTFLKQLYIRGLRLDGCTADISLQRLGSEVAATVTERHGNLRVVVVH